MDSLKLNLEILKDLYESKIFCNLKTLKIVSCIFSNEGDDTNFIGLNERNLKLENLEL
jgi:hypothetical protein